MPGFNETGRLPNLNEPELKRDDNGQAESIVNEEPPPEDIDAAATESSIKEARQARAQKWLDTVKKHKAKEDQGKLKY